MDDDLADLRDEGYDAPRRKKRRMVSDDSDSDSGEARAPRKKSRISESVWARQRALVNAGGRVADAMAITAAEDGADESGEDDDQDCDSSGGGSDRDYDDDLDDYDEDDADQILRRIRANPLPPCLLEEQRLSEGRKLSVDDIRDMAPADVFLIRHLDTDVYYRAIGSLARRLYVFFNQEIFADKLPPMMTISFSGRMTSTAGTYSCRHGSQAIKLSTVVLNELWKLKRTLCHEMCHAAVFHIDKKREVHGRTWWKWANRASDKYPLYITRCHSYRIAPRVWLQCDTCFRYQGLHGRGSLYAAQIRHSDNGCKGSFSECAVPHSVSQAMINDAI